MAQSRLKRVSDLVLELPVQLKSGDISVQSLQLVVQSGLGWKTLVRQVFRETGGEAVVSVLEAEVAKRGEELREFEKLKTAVRVLDDLCGYPAQAQLADGAVLKALLQQDVSGFQLSRLCTRQAEGPCVFRWPFFEQVTQHIAPATLEQLSVCRDSLIFQQKWELAARRAPAPQLSTWVAQMWTPLLAEWTLFRNALAAGSILIQDAKEKFERVPDVDIEQELTRLARSTPGGDGGGWVRERARQLTDIRKVERNERKARASLTPVPLSPVAPPHRARAAGHVAMRRTPAWCAARVTWPRGSRSSSSLQARGAAEASLSLSLSPLRCCFFSATGARHPGGGRHARARPPRHRPGVRQARGAAGAGVRRAAALGPQRRPRARV